MPEGLGEELVKTVVQVSVTYIEREVELAEGWDLTGIFEEEVVPVPHVLDEEFDSAVLGDSLELGERYMELAEGMLPLLLPGEVSGVDDHRCTNFTGKREAGPDHLNARPPDRLVDACNIDAP